MQSAFRTAAKTGKPRLIGGVVLVRHQGLSVSAARIRRPALAAGVLGPEGSTGAFRPFVFEPPDVIEP